MGCLFLVFFGGPNAFLGGFLRVLKGWVSKGRVRILFGKIGEPWGRLGESPPPPLWLQNWCFFFQNLWPLMALPKIHRCHPQTPAVSIVHRKRKTWGNKTKQTKQTKQKQQNNTKHFLNHWHTILPHSTKHSPPQTMLAKGHHDLIHLRRTEHVSPWLFRRQRPQWLLFFFLKIPRFC